MEQSWKTSKFFGQFAICIKKLEGDESLLSTAYLEYQQLKIHVQNNTDLPEIVRNEVDNFGSNQWQSFLYNPVVIVTYKLDPWHHGNHLNARTFDPIIEKKIIQLAGKENKDIVLIELAEYVRKTGGFAHSHLWGDVIQKPINWWNLMKGKYPILSDVAIWILSISATSAASERNWSIFGFIHSKLRNRLHEKQVEKIVYIFWNLRILCAIDKQVTIKGWVDKILRNRALEEAAERDNNGQEVDDTDESDFSDLNYSDIDELLGEGLDEFQDLF